MLQKNRDLSVDLAKGIGIMLVVTGHAGCPEIPHGIIYSFHMPLFFMLSGLFIQRQCQDKLGVYLKKNFRSLLLPYLYFNLISIAFYYVMSVVLHKNLLNGSVMDNLIGIFVSMRWGTPYHHVLWFLPCLFLAKVMVYPLYHNELWGGKIVISILSLIAGLVYCRYADNPLPWSLDAALVALFFIVVGQQYMQHRTNVDKIVKRYRCFLVIVFLLSSFFNFNEIEMYENRYGNEFLFLLGSISASILIFWFCGTVKNKSNLIILITKFGKLSLLVYIIHNYFLLIPGTLHNRLIHHQEGGMDYAFWILSTIFVLSFVLPLCIQINKRAKWLIGK